MVGNNAVFVNWMSKLVVPLGSVITGFGFIVSTLMPGSLTKTKEDKRLLSSAVSSTWSVGSTSIVTSMFPDAVGVQSHSTGTDSPGAIDIVLTPSGCPAAEAVIERDGTEPAPRFTMEAPTVTASPTWGMGVEREKLSESTVGSGVRSLTLTPLIAIEYGWYCRAPEW